ncbi:MAG: peptidylprolyl isomerase [Alphaproteobacteria bacterium]|nr:peptidylprolyl isomerase [Alphaproteobacteria bacterium]
MTRIAAALFNACRNGLVLVLAVMAASPTAAPAQQTLRIAAVVNDEVISVRDLENATRLATVVSRLPATPETNRRIRGQVLQSQINDTLYLQEARQNSVTVSDAEMSHAAGLLEQRLGIRPGTLDDFLAANRLNRRMAMRQMRASIAWSKLVRRRFGSVATVAEEEIDEVLDIYRRSLGRPQYLVSEILLPVNDPGTEAQVRGLASRIYQQLQQPGSDFRAIARQFSSSASSAQGGLIGWVTAVQLAPEIETLLSGLGPGEVASPVRTDSGFQIVKLENRRILRASDPLKSQVKLRFLSVPLPVGGEENASAGLIREMEQDVADVRSCPELAQLADARDGASSGVLGPILLEEAAPAVREIVLDLDVGAASRAIRMGTAVSVFMVCERTAAPENTPDRDNIVARLRAEKLRSLARRYLRNLRQSAFIETR